jgi:tripartite-type tricarboxylate transporter receptor subunit TctC
MQQTRTVLACAIAAATVCPGTVAAQQAGSIWPSKLVTIINPFTPGAVTDIEARLYAQKLNENTGQNFVVDYKPGAGAMVGAGYVVKSPPNGSTLLIATSGLTIAPLVFKDLGFDPIKDLAYVSMMSKRAPPLLANPKFPPNNGAEYIAYAKAHPGKINFGTSGITGAGHLSMQWLHQLTGTKVTFIHYKGGAPSVAAVISGEVDVIISSVIGSRGNVQAGKVKILGIMSAQRTPSLPNIPTITEQTVPGWEYAPWLGIATPAATPAAILDRMNAELVKVAKDPVLAEKLAADATFMMGSSRQEFTQFVTSESARWAKLVRDLGIKLES